MASGSQSNTEHPPFEARAAHYASAAAVGAAGLAVCVLVGWMFGIETLKRVRPDFVAMNPTTAVAFALAGAALWLLRAPSPGGLRRATGHAAAALVALIGLLRLAMVITGDGLHVDQWLLPAGSVEPTGVPNSMAPNTAVLFALSGAALLLLDNRFARSTWLSDALSLVSLSAATMALIGYLYGVAPLYGVAAFIPMALPTAAGFLLLFSGILAARPDRPVMSRLLSPRPGGLVLRRVLPGTIVIVVVLGLLRLQGEVLGLYDAQTGVSIMSACTIVLLSAMAFLISRGLDRIDAQREAAAEELLRANAAARANAELLAAILENIADGVIVADGAGGTIHRNPAAEAILGPVATGPSVQWTGGAQVLVRDGGKPISVEELALVRAASGEHVTDQEQFLAAAEGGGGKWLSASARPLTGPRGGAVLVVRDVTARKLAELKLEDQNDVLEALVANRTAELTRSNQDLQQFAYVASHDLQEPLRMVGSYLQLLERRYKAQLDEHAQEFIGYAVDGANRMKQLINDLLQYSRVDRKGGNVVEADPSALVGDAMQALGAAITESAATIEVGQLPPVQADPALLRQLFQNLIGNAIKFRGHEPPRISVSAEHDPVGWRFSVTDNGIGIEPQYATRIFDVFQRLHGREHYAGTGIGLAICKKIVERHGGRIWVEPAGGGGGSRFVFTIPDRKGVVHEHRAAA